MAKLPHISGQHVYRPATDTAAGGAIARSYKKRKKDSAIYSAYDYQPHPTALESLRELKREMGIL